MEAAALFAVAQYRGVELASAFVISDSRAGLHAQPLSFTSETFTESSTFAHEASL
jgi:uridine phosphorylase